MQLCSLSSAKSSESKVPYGGGGGSRTGGIRAECIEGGFVKVTTHQLMMAAWLYRDGHITRQQFRVWLAAFELLERRRHMPDEREQGGKRPHFRLSELQSLVGGSERKIRTDLSRLDRLGLVSVAPHEIGLAVSIDQIRIEDVSGFWEMYQHVENQQRPIPVPRRTLKAMAAGGFGRAETMFMIGILIRSLFWHREQGDYRVDGRMKLSWLSDVFRISRRAATNARARLIELGWIEPIDCPQYELNRWGLRHRLATEWVMPAAEAITNEPIEAQEQGGHAPEIATPEGDSTPEIASPNNNQSASLTRTKIKTRKLRSGVCFQDGILGERQKQRRCGRGGAHPGNPRSRKTRSLRRDTTPAGCPSAPAGVGPVAPSLQDIQTRHLRGTEELLELYRQAVGAGLISDCEAGRLDFLALAERARSRGRNPGGMLRWLLVNRKFEFITQAEEDAAAERLREHRNGPCLRDVEPKPPVRAGGWNLSEDDRIVRACIVAGKQQQVEPLRIAQQWQGWSKERWEQAHLAYEQKEFERWR